jgi:hypothetical protein
MSSKKLITALVATGVITAGLVGAGIHALAAEPTIVEINKEVRVEVPVEKIVTKDVPGPIEYRNITVEDTAFKALACDRLHYDVVAECVEEVNAEDAALKLALAEIKDSFAAELEDADIVAKEKYAELVKLYTAYDDLTVEDSDFDNEEYTFVIKAKINDNHEEAKSYVNFTVDVKDGEAKIVDVESI